MDIWNNSLYISAISKLRYTHMNGIVSELLENIRLIVFFHMRIAPQFILTYNNNNYFPPPYYFLILEHSVP